jgi:hypothetical protein
MALASLLRQNLVGSQHMMWKEQVARKRGHAVQAGNVVEEGSHEELWSSSTTMYHSLVALQEAATDRCDQLSAGDLEEIVKKDATLAEQAAAKATMEQSQQGSSKGKEGSNAVEKPIKKALTSGKKITASREEQKVEEELVCSLLFCIESCSFKPLKIPNDAYWPENATLCDQNSCELVTASIHTLQVGRFNRLRPGCGADRRGEEHQGWLHEAAEYEQEGVAMHHGGNSGFRW